MEYILNAILKYEEKIKFTEDHIIFYRLSPEEDGFYLHKFDIPVRPHDKFLECVRERKNYIDTREKPIGIVLGSKHNCDKILIWENNHFAILKYRSQFLIKNFQSYHNDIIIAWLNKSYGKDLIKCNFDLTPRTILGSNLKKLDVIKVDNITYLDKIPIDIVNELSKYFVKEEKVVELRHSVLCFYYIDPFVDGYAISYNLTGPPSNFEEHYRIDEGRVTIINTAINIVDNNYKLIKCLHLKYNKEILAWGKIRSSRGHPPDSYLDDFGREYPIKKFWDPIYNADNLNW